MASRACISSRKRVQVSAVRRLALAVGLVVVAGSVLVGCAKVPGVYTYEAKRSVQPGTARFNAASYVESIWASRILPTVASKAVDAATLLPAIARNATAAGRKYGHQADDGSPYSFLIKGAGTVVKVDTSAHTGPVTVNVDSAGRAAEVQLATGPVFVGTALRDAVGFIKFNDFTNQIDYANVALALNAKVRADVVASLDRNTLHGKHIRFAGSFTLLP